MRKNYRIKKTISMKKFISEFGADFSEHMKSRLLELEIRTVLSREEHYNIFDLRHVEHTQFDFQENSDNGSIICKKEYLYGEFMAVDGGLYFSEKCSESPKFIESPVVSSIYNTLSSENMISNDDNNAKKIDDSNIDYVVDALLTACPQVSQSYLNIMSKYL